MSSIGISYGFIHLTLKVIADVQLHCNTWLANFLIKLPKYRFIYRTFNSMKIAVYDFQVFNHDRLAIRLNSRS